MNILIVVDMQNDFVKEGGTLVVPDPSAEAPAEGPADDEDAASENTAALLP